MAAIPRESALDSTLDVLREGYSFIPNRCRRFGSDLFETRIMLTRAVCLSGPEAAAQFYRPDRITRRGGMPQPSFRLIQDNGSVMVLDGAAHRRRKALFLSLMGPDAMARLAEITARHWLARIPVWAGMERVALFHEAHVPLCGAVCEWAGIPLDEAETGTRARDFEAMVEGTGSVGWRHLRGHVRRARAERWMRGVIARIRSGALAVPEGSAAASIAGYREEDGALLDVTIAAVELINVLRPTVANARYVTFAAHALHGHPAWRERLRAGDEGDLARFVLEVRRLYPFIPFIGGRVLEAFEWRGRRFARDEWVLMDLYGTNRDPRSWGDPERFDPDRFREWRGDPFTMIPQGGGEHAGGHRCPGEWATIEQVKAVTRLLVGAMRYEVPPQDLAIDLGRMPALPRSRFVMTGVRAV